MKEDQMIKETSLKPKEIFKIVINILKHEGWKVRSGAGQTADFLNFYYTTPDDRTSTICLQIYDTSQFWRWHIDRCSIRIRGKNKLVRPCPPPGLQNYAYRSELTIYENELIEPFAQWFADWMIAANNEKKLPACPILLSNSGILGKTYQGGYCWSAKAQTKIYIHRSKTD